MEISCNLCPEKFPSSIHFRRHSIDVHRKSNNTLVKKNKEPFCCDECGKTFKVKFIFSEKATKFYEISTLLLSYVVPFKSKVDISQNFVAFSEYMNFNILYSCLLCILVLSSLIQGPLYKWTLDRTLSKFHFFEITR